MPEKASDTDNHECPTCKAQKEPKTIDREAAGQLSLLDKGKTL